MSSAQHSHAPTFGCLMEIAAFLHQKNLPYADQFFDLRWLARLALLTDITTYLNALNVKLQGKDILITDMHTHITAYDVGRPGIVEAQSANGQLEHFPRLVACVPDDVEPDTCVSVVTCQREEFASRFAGVRPLAADFKVSRRRRPCPPCRSAIPPWLMWHSH